MFFGFGYGGATRIGTESEWPSGSGTKDSLTKAVVLGMLVPAAIVAVTLLNIMTGRVYWPAGRGVELVVVYTGFWQVIGTVLLKLGVAGLLVAWYGLANFRRTEPAYGAVAIWSGLAAVAGLITFVIGTLL